MLYSRQRPSGNVGNEITVQRDVTHLRAVLGVGGPLLLHPGLQQLQEVEAVQGVTASLPIPF